MWGSSYALLGLSVLHRCAAFEKVSVKVMAESGCPTSRRVIAGAINRTLSSPGMAAIMDFDFVPFGNAFFSTTKCGGGPYSFEKSTCFINWCGHGADEPLPEDCFMKPLICEHGELECQGNRYLACAKSIVGASAFMKYMPFVTCLEAAYERLSSEVAMSCAVETGIDKDALSACYAGPEGDKAVIEQARFTDSHPLGVPCVMVNYWEINPDNLIGEVCKKYEGPPPKACFPSQHLLV